MLKKILISFLFLTPFILLSPTQTINNSDQIEVQKLNKELHQKCLYPVLQVINKNSYGMGTGFVVKSVKISDNKYKNVFLTCAHVCTKENDFSVIVYEYKNWSTVDKTEEYPCYFYSKNFELDVAIGVFVSNKPLHIAKIDFTSDIFIGNSVITVGCGMGGDPRLGEGKITGIHNIISSPTQDIIKTSIFTIPGDSGSPLFNENYEVIGIMQSIRIHNNVIYYNISHAAPMNKLIQWSKSDGDAYDFIWTENLLPKMPFYMININSKIKIPE